MPEPAWEVYDRNAEEFADATALDELPESFFTLLESFVDALSGPDVLDAGCGPGRDAAYFQDQGLDPVGFDVADGMLAQARANAPGWFLKMDIRALGFHDGAFDGVWCPASVFFVPPEGMATALAEFARVLRPDGVARVGFKLGDGPTEVEKWGETTMEYHVSEDEARVLLEDAGFRVESVDVNEVSPERTFANFLCRLAAEESSAGESGRVREP